MSTKTKLLQKLQLGERGIVIQDLIRLFQKSSDEKLEGLLENIKLQYNDLTKLIRDNKITIEQRTQRENVIDEGLTQIIEQLKDEIPKFIWLILALVLIPIGKIVWDKFIQPPKIPIVQAFRRDTFTLCINSDTLNYVMNEGITEMVAEVNQRMKGRLAIVIQRNSNVAEAESLLDDVHDGKKIQMFHSISYYWNKTMPASIFFAAVPFGMDKDEMEIWLAEDGLRLWRALYHKKGLVPFALGHTGQQWGGFFNKEVKTLKDFKGLTMRIGGEAGKILDREGVTPTQVVPNQTDLDSFFRNDPVNKAFEWIGPSVDYKIGLHKYFKYYYEEGWHEPNTLFSLYINEAAWEKVKDIQPQLEDIFQKYNNKISSMYQVKNNEYKRKLMQEKPDMIRHFSCDLLKMLEDKTTVHFDKYRFEHKKSYLMDSIANSYFSFHKKYKKDILFSTCK
jgi:TRAP-type mannitol/chloroaromatic compound transport system substrate-binding protein